MPISGETVEKLRSFTRQACCPLCGKADQTVESLTSCGHYLCAKCLNDFVLKAESKCPKCYAINYRNDCKEDIFVNNVHKMAQKLNQLLDQQTTSARHQSKSEEVSKGLVQKPSEEPKGSKKRSDLILESLKACTKTKPKPSASAGANKTGNKVPTSGRAMAAPKPKKSVEYIDEDLDSIPDSFDMSFTQSSSTKGEGKSDGVVDAVLKAFEATKDCVSLDMSSMNKSEEKSAPDAKSRTKTESKSCQRSPNLEDRGVQTSQKPNTKVVLHSVSTQCLPQKSKQTDKSAQTVPSVDTTSAGHTCQPSSCGFHKMIDSIECSSLQTFLKSLMSLSESSTKSNESSLNLALVSGAGNALKPKQNSGEILISSSNFYSTNEEVVASIESIPEIVSKPEITTKSAKAPKSESKKPNINIRTATKGASIGPKSAKNRRKSYVSSDDDSSVEEIEDKEPVMEAMEEKEKPKEVTNKGFKSRKVSNRKSIGLKPPAKRRNTKELVVDLKTAIDVEEGDRKVEKVGKRNTNRNIIEKKVSNTEQTLEKTSVEEPMEEIFDCGDIDVVEESVEEKIESKQRSRRKVVPKRFSKVEEWDETKEMETKISKDNETIANPRKRQLIVEDQKDLEEIRAKIRAKPVPKSKRPSSGESVKELNKDVFKRPASPSPSEVSDISMVSSTSSRHRTSSSERSNEKFVVLSSGLNEKQTKKIQSLCRELNAEAVIDWSDKVTHLVISQVEGMPKKDMMCPRNAKYLKALLSNKWIISYDWIVDSDRSNRFLPELKYEISADRTATERQLPKTSRMSGKKLFENLSFCFEGDFGSLLTDLTQFVTIGGGLVVDSIDVFERKRSKKGSDKLVVVTESIGFPNTQNNGIKYLSKKAFMDSISNFQTI